MRGPLALLAVALAVLCASLAITAEPPSADQVEVRGIVLDPTGQPAADAIVTAISEPYDSPTTKTDAQGQFAMHVDRKRSPSLRLLASADDGRRKALFARDENTLQALDAVQIKFGKVREFKIFVVDEKQQPIAGASAIAVASYSKLDEQPTDAKGEATLVVPAGVTLQYVYALKPKVGLDYYYFRQAYQPDETNPYWLEQDHNKPLQFTLRGIQPVTVRVVDEMERPLAGVRVAPWYIQLPKKGGDLNTVWTHRITGADGIAQFDTVPSGTLSKINFNASKARYSPARQWFDPQSGEAELLARLLPQTRLQGKVWLPDGKPAPGAVVAIYGSGHNHTNFRGEARCDQNGDFEQFVDANMYYAFIARHEQLVSKAESQVVVLGREPKPLKLKLAAATRVHGILRNRKDQTPLANSYLSLAMEDFANKYLRLPDDEKMPNPSGDRSSIDPHPTHMVRTDENGRFEIYAAPGTYYLTGLEIGGGAPKLQLEGQKEIELNLESARPTEIPLEGKIVLRADGKRTVAEARVDGLPLVHDIDLRNFGAVSLADGSFKGKRSPAEMVLVARSADQLLGGVATILSEDEEATIALEPTVTVRGRLIDDETGKPLPEQQVDYAYEIRYPKVPGKEPGITSSTHFFGNLFGSTTTDAGGRFVLSGLVVGGTYRLQMVSKRGPDGLPREHAMLSSIVPEKPDVIELGDVKLVKPKEFKPPTLDELIDRAMTPKPVYEKGRLSTQSLEDRMTLRQRDARLAEQQLLVIAVAKKSPICRQFHARYYGHDDPEREKPEQRQRFFQFLGNYALLAVDTTEGKPLDSARKTLESLKVPLPEEDAATIAILDQEGKLVAAAASGELLDKDEHLDIEKLLEFVNKHARALPNAEKLLADGLARAKREDKRVLVQISGAFCAPCVLLSRYLDEHQELIAKDYVVVKLDNRFIGGEETIKRVRTDANKGGIPWTVILDSTGKELATSTAKSGNIGFPSTPEGIEHFEKMLSSTAQRLTKEEIGKLVEALGTPSPPR